MKRQLFLLVYILFGCILSYAQTVEIYVSPNGSDLNNGSLNKPLATFAVAQQKTRAYAGKEKVTIYFC